MADVRLRIEVNPNAESETLGDIVNNNAEVSNISVKLNSNNVFQNIPTSESVGLNGLSYSKDLVFDKDGYLDNEDLMGAVLESEENPTQFVWGIVPSNNEYHVKLTFTNSSNLKDIVIYGDKGSNQFPTRAIIDNTSEITNDDFKWDIDLQTESDTHTIEFTHWNRANYNAIISMIGVMMKYFEVDKNSGLKSVESLSQSTGQPKEIFYGVVPSTGSLEIIDVNGEIGDMVRDGIIPTSNVKIDIVANSNQVQSCISSNNEYRTTTGSKILTMQLDNSLSNWNNINYVGYRLNNQMSLYNIVLEVLSTLYSMLDIEEMIEDVKDYLQSIIIDHPYIQSGTLRDTIDKICTIAQLNVFQNDDGKIKFVSARPTLSKDRQIISILKRNQLQPLDADLIVKNKFESVNVKFNKTTLEDKSLNTRTTKYFDYETLSQNFQGYDVVINNENINPNLTILRNNIASENNPTTTVNGSFWYYYIAKYKVSYDILDLKILRDFSPKISKQVTALFPPSGGIKTLYFADEVLTPYDANYTDDEIISEWLVSTNNGIRIKSGTPNLGFKVRKNEDGSFTLFYVSLLYITSKDVAYVGTNENIITAIYNEINIDFKAPQITQSVYSPLNNADVTIEANELLQDTAKIGEEKISTIISNNILLDYQNGIINGTMSVNCLDYYDINGNRVKNWANGEILQVGDIVRVNGDNYGNSAMKYADGSDMYFKVTGRRFRKQGVPLIDLELQEVK